MSKAHDKEENICDHKFARLTTSQIDALTDKEYRAKGLEEVVISKSHEFLKFCTNEDVLSDYLNVQKSKQILVKRSEEMLEAAPNKKMFADYCHSFASHGHFEFLIPYALCAKRFPDLHIDTAPYDKIGLGVLGDLEGIFEE
jgi:hypothetical protein